MQAIAKILKIHIVMGKKFKSLVSEEGRGQHKFSENDENNRRL